MNAKNLFSTVAVISSVFGLALVFAPDFMGDQYLANPSWINEGATFLAQGWGVTLIAIGAACWYVRTDGPTLGHKAMLLLLLVVNLGFLLIHIVAIMNGVETALGWVQVVMSVIIAGWAGMLLRQERIAVA
ncbi:hypothetical protein [Spirosoma koreense]